MKWATWENVGVDRMACAWLIRKHIDPKATFAFVPKGTSELPKRGRAVRHSRREAFAPAGTLLVPHDFG